MIDDFLLGRMTCDERSAFEEALETNVELREQKDFTEMVLRVMEMENEKK